MSTKEGFHVRYLDPDNKLPKLEASPETPDIHAGFGNKENIKWIEKDIPYEGDETATHRIWDALYDTIRTGKAFPIKLDQAAKVIEVIEKVKQGTIFED